MNLIYKKRGFAVESIVKFIKKRQKVTAKVKKLTLGGLKGYSPGISMSILNVPPS
jgi:hypothetical protein